MESCTIGKITHTECHLDTYTRKHCLHDFKILSLELLQILELRLNNYEFSTGFICNHDKCKYIDYYSQQMRKCCDPLQLHKTRIDKNLRIVSEELSDQNFEVEQMRMIPGDKLCDNCRKRVREIIKKSANGNSRNLRQLKARASYAEITQPSNEEQKKVGEILTACEISPPKNISVVASTVTDSLIKDSLALDEIVRSLQQKFYSSPSHNEKLQTLLLLPKNWNFKLLNKYFGCSAYMYRAILKIRSSPDFLEVRKKQYKQKFSVKMVEYIVSYYRSDQNCYICPGKKDCITISSKENPKKKICLQKRVLLYTLRDLYENFKHDLAGEGVIPKFSFFASLRPAECIFAGAPGTHTIYVCEEHENIRLKLYALDKSLKYKDLVQGSVCDFGSIECMLHRCKECSGVVGIERKFSIIGVSWPRESIKYKIWKTEKCRASLVDAEENAVSFKRNLLSDLWKLTIHRFIAASQKTFLQECKEELNPDTAIVLMDFSENYSFIIQKSVQAFYYNNSQATLHPFVVYYKRDGKSKLEEKSFCIISDTKDHFAYTIHAFQEAFLKNLGEQLPWIKKIIYFSVGAPTQYKNKNNFANICLHRKDFNYSIQSYNFFATSHGKSPCDAIGGTLKRTVMRHCIRSSADQQITTPKEMYDYAVREIKGIDTIWVSDVEVQKAKKKLNARFNAAKRVVGTRSYHTYIPIDDNTLQIKKRYMIM